MNTTNRARGGTEIRSADHFRDAAEKGREYMPMPELRPITREQIKAALDHGGVLVPPEMPVEDRWWRDGEALYIRLSPHDEDFLAKVEGLILNRGWTIEVPLKPLYPKRRHEGDEHNPTGGANMSDDVIIIKPGKIPRTEMVREQFECEYCGCVFSAWRDGCATSVWVNETCYQHLCPTCGRNVNAVQ